MILTYERATRLKYLVCICNQFLLVTAEKDYEYPYLEKHQIIRAHGETVLVDVKEGFKRRTNIKNLGKIPFLMPHVLYLGIELVYKSCWCFRAS